MRGFEEAKLEEQLTGNARAYAESYEERDATCGYVAPPKIESVTRIRVCEDAVHAIQPGNQKSLRLEVLADSCVHRPPEEVSAVSAYASEANLR